MNRIIKSMLTIAAVFTVATVSAQPPRGEGHDPAGRAKRMSERMAEKLDLTDAQKQQIHDLHIELAKQAEADRPTGVERGRRRERGEKPTDEQISAMKEAREAMTEKHKARMEEIDARLKTILTPEQYEKWETERAREHREGDRVERGNRRPDSGEASEKGRRKNRRARSGERSEA